MGVEQAIMVKLRELRELIGEGWPRGSTDGERIPPQLVFADSGYMQGRGDEVEADLQAEPLVQRAL